MTLAVSIKCKHVYCLQFGYLKHQLLGIFICDNQASHQSGGVKERFMKKHHRLTENIYGCLIIEITWLDRYVLMSICLKWIWWKSCLNFEGIWCRDLKVYHPLFSHSPIQDTDDAPFRINGIQPLDIEVVLKTNTSRNYWTSMMRILIWFRCRYCRCNRGWTGRSHHLAGIPFSCQNRMK